MRIPILAFCSLSLMLLSFDSIAKANASCQDIQSCYQLAQSQPLSLTDKIQFVWRPGVYNQDHTRRESASIRRQPSATRSSRASSTRSVRSVTKPKQGPANPKGTFVFNPRTNAFGFYNSQGILVMKGPASGGMGWCESVQRSCRTPVGRFRVYSKGTADCVSSKYPLPNGGAPMPHCMFFRGGYAIHGSPHVPNRPASHGCIRVHPWQARLLHQNHIKHGTVVVVKPY